MCRLNNFLSIEFIDLDQNFGEQVYCLGIVKYELSEHSTPSWVLSMFCATA